MKSRLSQLDWLDHGLKVLARNGHEALKADTLAKLLKVSRGSFYWHFRDIEHFHNELLGRWRTLATDEIIVAVDRECSDTQRLRRLMRGALTGDVRLERGIRSWAAQSGNAARAISSVDKARVEYLREILRSTGLTDKQVAARATFIYWAYIGKVMVGKGLRSLDDDEIHAVADVMLSSKRGIK
ncbi:MAG: TetR/AcrR family transcriptional regulator [Hyphomicrobiaceae bacterium]